MVCTQPEEVAGHQTDVILPICAEGSLDISTTQAYDDTVRELERGSVIVCVCPNDIKVVLQVNGSTLLIPQCTSVQ
jgi:hypothetical protein